MQSIIDFKLLERLRVGPLAPYLDIYISRIEQDGFLPSLVPCQLYATTSAGTSNGKDHGSQNGTEDPAANVMSTDRSAEHSSLFLGTPAKGPCRSINCSRARRAEHISPP
jgi:hypothetical protein